MLDAHDHVMQVKLCKANTRGVTHGKQANNPWATLQGLLEGCKELK